MTGQIQPNSPFGRVIISVASRPGFATFCEIGAWNGEGSTRCLFEGARQHGGHIYSVEGDPEMYKQAERVWRNNPLVHLSYGTVHRNVLTREQVTSHSLFNRVSDHYNLWYDTEYKTAMTAPLVTVPACDVILLDGGEFSTQGDWDTLNHPNLRAVLLDDTQVIKTNAIREQLFADPTWTCLRDEPTDRNGWAVFLRK